MISNDRYEYIYKVFYSELLDKADDRHKADIRALYSPEDIDWADTEAVLDAMTRLFDAIHAADNGARDFGALANNTQNQRRKK